MADERNGTGTANGNGKPQRSWDENVRARGIAILMKMVMPILHDSGDQDGRATKVRVREILCHAGHFTFIMEVPNDAERGRVIGQRCLNLSALSVLFRTALRATFKAEERPDVVVGIWDPFRQRTLMPQRLFLESDLEPEEPVHALVEETEDDGTPGTTP